MTAGQPDPLTAPLAQVASELLGTALEPVRHPANDRHTTDCVYSGRWHDCDGACAREDDPVTAHRAELDDPDYFPEDEPFEATIDRPQRRSRVVEASEAEVQQDCIRWLRAQPQCVVRKVHGSGVAGGGEPDLDICWHGRAVKIELKSDGGGLKPTPAQHGRLLEWQAAGALVGWASNLAELQQIIARADDTRYVYIGQAGGELPPTAPPEPEKR